jgi:hypothetical protein
MIQQVTLMRKGEKDNRFQGGSAEMDENKRQF